jgi:sec-independent protein translocase protein TatB
MLNIGPQELLVILIVALLVVGPQRLPELSRQLGRGLREFRKIQDDVKGMVNLDEVKNMVNLDEVKNMVTFDADGPATADPPTSAPTTKRVNGTATPPAVHRAPRPAPGAPAANRSEPAAPDASSDG